MQELIQVFSLPLILVGVLAVGLLLAGPVFTRWQIRAADKELEKRRKHEEALK